MSHTGIGIVNAIHMAQRGNVNAIIFSYFKNRLTLFSLQHPIINR